MQPNRRDSDGCGVGYGFDSRYCSAETASTLAALTTAYAAGLCASEVASLKVAEIDSSRMVTRVGAVNTLVRCRRAGVGAAWAQWHTQRIYARSRRSRSDRNAPHRYCLCKAVINRRP